MDFRLAIAQQILSALPEAPLEAADVASMLEVPPDTKLGDYAFPCFKLLDFIDTRARALSRKLRDVGEDAPALPDEDAN